MAIASIEMMPRSEPSDRQFAVVRNRRPSLCRRATEGVLHAAWRCSCIANAALQTLGSRGDAKKGDEVEWSESSVRRDKD